MIAGALLAPAGILVTVQVGTLLGEHKPGAVALGLELHGRQRHGHQIRLAEQRRGVDDPLAGQDRKSTRLNSSHVRISYAVFCLKKKKNKKKEATYEKIKKTEL